MQETVPSVCFNPRSHKGNDRAMTSSVPGVQSFNPRSHKGNDGDIFNDQYFDIGFNPRSHKGNDFYPPHHLPSLLKFQSTFPQGERLFVYLRLNGTVVVSIHVPTRGTTSRGSTGSHRHGSFNPRSHKGNDSNSPQIHPSFFSTNHQFLLYTPI